MTAASPELDPVPQQPDSLTAKVMEAWDHEADKLNGNYDEAAIRLGIPVEGTPTVPEPDPTSIATIAAHRRKALREQKRLAELAFTDSLPDRDAAAWAEQDRIDDEREKAALAAQSPSELTPDEEEYQAIPRSVRMVIEKINREYSNEKTDGWSPYRDDDSEHNRRIALARKEAEELGLDFDYSKYGRYIA